MTLVELFCLASKFVSQSLERVLDRIAGFSLDAHDTTDHQAGENPTRGYSRIRGALSNLGHDVGRSTIANIMKKDGMDPVPRRARRMSWRDPRPFRQERVMERVMV